MAELPAARHVSAYRDKRPGPSTTDGDVDGYTYAYDTGESSAAGSFLALTPAMDRARPDEVGDKPLDSGLDHGTRHAHGHGHAHPHRDDRTRRKPRQRATSAFLLHDAVPKDREAAHRRRTQKATLQPPLAPTTAPRTPDQNRQGSANYSIVSAPAATQQLETTPEPALSEDGDHPSGPQDSPGFDADSTQIVQMALNLSESRRIAARKSLSHAKPPKLMPLPDPANGSSLRQHLQQQRRSSRNISPKPNQGTTNRIPSMARANSPLQPAFLVNNEGRYRYQFSASTVARAQKAKEHLELMAEYRRLLEHLPPLRPGTNISPNLNWSSGTAGQKPSVVGRPYNPLQYIRNRKVRARERMVIDGENQGFADVESVRSWVDKISQQTSSSNSSPARGSATTAGNGFTIPPFSTADQLQVPNSPDAASKNTTRIRRPRVDWFLEPSDMIADVYWLEQGQNKHLIEDRQRRKIFPAPVEPLKPEQDSTQDQLNGLVSVPTVSPVGANDPREGGLTKVDTDISQSSAKTRAKQKFQDITGFHHRHSNSVHNHHDFLRRRKESISDLSGSEDESKSDARKKARHGRSGTITSNSNDLLQKQMMEMIAREAHERELSNLPETDAEHSEAVIEGTPEGVPFSTPSSYHDSRKGSVVDTSDSDYKPFFEKPRWGVPPKQRTGRTSLEVPDQPWQGSVENDSSLPGSPELKAVKDVSFVPANTIDSSQPPSRAGSPSRNPLSKVKQKLREKGREAGITQSHRSEDGHEVRERRYSFHELTPPKGTPSPEKSSPANEGKPFGRPGEETYRSHRRTASLRPRMDEQGVGLRGIFKGPRIDTVIRGGVSKLGDMLWKKDGSSDEPVEVGETDESDTDTPRGRRRSSTLAHLEQRRTQEEPQNASRNFLDTMPTFQHMANAQRIPSSNRDSKPSTSHHRMPSSASARFDLLKPPRIDIHSATSSATPSVVAQTPMADSEVSDAESYLAAGARNASRATGKHDSVSSVAIRSDEPSSPRQSRHWSIADQNHVEPKQLSRREVARVKALILRSGIKAMEINRRANEPHMPFKDALSTDKEKPQDNLARIQWDEIAKVSPALAELRSRQVVFCELYPFAAQTLGISIQTSGQRWQQAADRFSSRTSMDLRRRIWNIRQRVNDDLSNLTRSAADEADETSRDLALGQPLKVKHVVDTIDNMLRKRRRRFRWVRRGLWLMVEWALVGFMWYVWFVVMILRIFWGVGRGAWSGVRWLLWL